MTVHSIRPFETRDAPILTAVFSDSVRGGGARDYYPAQVEVWASSAPSPQRFEDRAQAGDLIWVAVDGSDQPLAYGILEVDGHLDHLYCRSDHIGTGLAAALYDHVEREARALGLTHLFTEASEAARRLFLRKDFVVAHRRDFELKGVAIHNYRMGKGLKRALFP